MSEKLPPIKLIEGNYEEWAFIMEAALKGHDLWSVVGPEVEELVPKGPKAVQTRKTKVELAKSKITVVLDISQTPFVMGLEDSHEIWMVLRDLHHSQSVNSVLSLRRCFFRMAKLKSETIMAYITRIRKAAYELSHTSAPVSELDMILVITDGLLQEYSTVVTALDDLPFDKLKMANVIMHIVG
ncbi:hypothetical protein NM688_g460 [Phlebia brevispora]|uniref:Uncharacterized protein n=1 Tax=Phlebia brevispora TaxID=194682 RepID=A0ACC1TDY4_9APHY|nr:hypothetical protein NM688_g460 [Phlebia brevispora]